MTLLNPALAFGALAFLVPLIIHILNRSRFKTVDWGAMHLLESVIKTNHKRLRLDQLILLLVRCMIPALLAFCIARPLLTSSKTMDASTPVSLVILLDASYSMETVEQGGTRMKKAIDAAKELVQSTHKGSDVYVVLLANQSVSLFDQPVFDTDAVIRRLNNLQGGFGECDIPTSIQDGLQTLDGMSNAHRELVIISDFQQKDWQGLLDNEAAEIQSLMESLELQPVLTLMPMGQSVTENISIQSIDHPTKAIGAGEPHSYRVNIENHGSTPSDNTRVVFRVNGKEESVSQVNLAASGSTQVLFTHTFDKPGSHLIEAEVVADDPLQYDNKRVRSVTVWDRIPVVLVDGAPNPQPLKSETAYVQVALTPFTLGRFQLTDLVETQTVRENSLDEQLTKTAQVIVLANVAKLSEKQTEALVEFVESGGVLFVFPGDQIDLKWYRETLFDEGRGILPAPFGARKTSNTRAPKVVAQRFDHPSLEHFNEAANGDLSAADIRNWYLLDDKQIDASTDKRKPASVMARLDNSDPFLVEGSYGNGVVIQMATTCDADWNNLPMQPVFLPLMQQLITTTASRMVPQRNLKPGEPAIILFDTDDAAQTIAVQTPSGSERVIQTTEVGGRQVGSFDSTTRPGVYTFATKTGSVRFSVQESRRESAPTLLADEKITQVATNLDAQVVKSSAEYLAQDNLRRNGSEIWKYLLMAFLAFLFLEVVLQQKFSGVRT